MVVAFVDVDDALLYEQFDVLEVAVVRSDVRGKGQICGEKDPCEAFASVRSLLSACSG